MGTVNAKFSIDWLTATTGLQTDLSYILHSDFEIINTRRPMPRYDEAWDLRNGATINKAINANLRGWNLQLTGDVLLPYTEQGLTHALLSRIMGTFDRFTRIDLAMDILGAGKPMHVLNHHAAGKVKTRLRADTLISGLHEEGGDTLYFGSKKSDRRVRIYDKAKELKLLQIAWTRVELQARKEFATVAAQDVNRHGINRAIPSIITSVIDCPSLSWWARATNGEYVPVTKIPRKPSSWRKWMDTDVMQSIANHAHDNDDWLFITEWHERVRRVLLKTASLTDT